MKKTFATLLILALLLTGCAVAPAQESTAPSTTLPAKTEPVATTPSTAPVTEPATEPATEPPTEPAEPYDTYFATEIPCPIESSSGDAYLALTAPDAGPDEFAWLVQDYHVRQFNWKAEDLGRPVLTSTGCQEYRLLSEDTVAEITNATSNYCVAVSEDRGTLLRLSYTEGVEPVTLYTDPYGRISSPKVYDQCLFFVAGMDETTNGIYRYYLPDGTVDLLVKDLPAAEDGDNIRFQIVSNVTLAWTVMGKPTLQDMEDYWETEFQAFGGKTAHAFFSEVIGKDLPTAADFLATDEPERRHQYEDVLEFLLYQGNDKYSVHYYYENFLTGETLEAYGYMRRLFDDYYYPDGTMRPKEEYSNGMLWWLDSYYQK